jgi:hypothetical protein
VTRLRKALSQTNHGKDVSPGAHRRQHDSPHHTISPDQVIEGLPPPDPRSSRSRAFVANQKGTEIDWIANAEVRTVSRSRLRTLGSGRIREHASERDSSQRLSEPSVGPATDRPAKAQVRLSRGAAAGGALGFTRKHPSGLAGRTLQFVGIAEARLGSSASRSPTARLCLCRAWRLANGLGAPRSVRTSSAELDRPTLLLRCFRRLLVCGIRLAPPPGRRLPLGPGRTGVSWL